MNVFTYFDANVIVKWLTVSVTMSHMKTPWHLKNKLAETEQEFYTSLKDRWITIFHMIKYKYLYLLNIYPSRSLAQPDMAQK